MFHLLTDVKAVVFVSSDPILHVVVVGDNAFATAIYVIAYCDAQGGGNSF